MSTPKAPAEPAAPTLRGLSEPEAAALLRVHGPNELTPATSHGLLATLLGVVREPMLLLLACCGAIYLFLGSRQEAILLFTFVTFVFTITLLQERRTERAVAALRELSSPRALVRRDGQPRRVPGRAVVPGDLLLLAEGDRVAADAVLLESSYLAADESLLTGESVPVRKLAGAEEAPPSRPGGDDQPWLYAGSLVVKGHGLARVRATGSRTQMGHIGKALATLKEEQTPLQHGVNRLVRTTAAVGIGLSVLLAVCHGALTGAWLKGLLAGLALAMSVLPEEMPMILAIIMSLGAWRLSRQGVLTRRTRAIEALGAATVLCVDKTGTLTQNRMTVAKLVVGSRVHDLRAETAALPAELFDLVTCAVLASQRAPVDPMELALHALGQRCPELIPTKHWTLLREYPLSSRLLAVCSAWLPAPDAPVVLAAKGAPEAVAALCRLSAADKQALLQEAERLADEGLRVLAVARAHVGKDELPTELQAVPFVLLGLVALADPIRPEVPAALAQCYRAGVRVIMVTGDYPATARSIARQIGLRLGEGESLTGAELGQMSDADLVQAARTRNVFARMTPEQKLRLVHALKAADEVVAMTGDGVNDAPALKAAHIGIAMGGRGTDVAREAAALVLVDDNFTSIVAAIGMGRRIFDNIRKAFSYTVAVHVPIAGLSLIPVLLKWPLILLPVHIAVMEMVIDPACSLIFEANAAEPDGMTRPPRPVHEPLFTRRMLFLSLLQGGAVLLACLLMLGGAFYSGASESKARVLTFSILITANLGLVLVSRSFRTSLFHQLRESSTALWAICAAALLMGALVLYVPPLRGLFGFAKMGPLELLVCIGAAVLSVGWFEVFKWRLRSATKK